MLTSREQVKAVVRDFVEECCEDIDVVVASFERGIGGYCDICELDRVNKVSEVCHVGVCDECYDLIVEEARRISEEVEDGQIAMAETEGRLERDLF